MSILCLLIFLFFNSGFISSCLMYGLLIRSLEISLLKSKIGLTSFKPPKYPPPPSQRTHLIHPTEVKHNGFTRDLQNMTPPVEYVLSVLRFGITHHINDASVCTYSLVTLSLPFLHHLYGICLCSYSHLSNIYITASQNSIPLYRKHTKRKSSNLTTKFFHGP